MDTPLLVFAAVFPQEQKPRTVAKAWDHSTWGSRQEGQGVKASVGNIASLRSVRTESVSTLEVETLCVSVCVHMYICMCM